MSQAFFRTSTLTVRRTAGIPARHLAASLSLVKAAVAATIDLWIARSRRRRYLSELALLDDYLLKDIGLSRDTALGEAAKPFWLK